jgi:hypothetical protein
MKIRSAVTTLVLAITCFIGAFLGNAHAQSTALFVVKDASNLNTMDSATRDRLVDQGFTVTLKSQGAAVSSDATGKSLVVISSSVASGNVNTKFKGTATPVLCMESFLFDDMMMTGGVQNTDYGTLSSQSQFSIVDESSPLAVGLTGNPLVGPNPKNFSWGKPSASAIKVATALGNSNQALVFAYEKGASMVGLNAPGRRVGFLMDYEGNDDLNDYMWEMFDAAVHWCARKIPALFVVGSTTLDMGDKAITNRLHSLGFSLSLKGASASHSTNAIGKSVVVVSASVSAGSVAAKFRTNAVPVVNMEAFVLDDMEYVAVGSTNMGMSAKQTQVVITEPPHPLAGRRSGIVTVYNSPTNMHWGRALPGAVQVAHQVNNSNRDLIFAYEPGSTMDGGFVAPARRVSLFPLQNSFTSLNASGLAMFDAAMRWSIQAPGSSIVEPVNFNPPAGAYSGTISLSLDTPTSGASIRYTLDGSTPTTNSTLYLGAFNISPPITVKAMAHKQGFINSSVTSASYTLQANQVEAPAINPPAGGYPGNVSVTLSSGTSGATIRYTTNGSTPTTNSTIYTGAFNITPPKTVKAMAHKSGMLNSTVTTASYTVQTQVDTPNISPGGGTISPNTSCSIFVTTPGATIFYTTDATPATTNSTVYTGSFLVNPGDTVRAIATAPGYTQSFEGFAFY